MAKVFEVNFGQGSYKDRISGTIPVKTNCVIKTTEKGRAAWFPTGAELNTFGVVTGVKTLAFVINPSGNGDIFLDNGTAKLSIVAGNISGTGLTECYVNNSDTDAITFGSWSLVIAEFSGGIDFSTDFEIDPTMTLFLAMAEADENLLSSLQRESLFQAFLHAQTQFVPLTNQGGLRPVGNFDGVDDYVYKAVANFRSSDSAGSVEAWINTVLSQYMTILSSSDEIISSYLISFGLDNLGRLRLLQRNNNTISDIIGSTVINDGKWHHIKYFSNGNTYILYVDREEETLTTNFENNGDWFADTENRDNICIGVLKRTGLSSHLGGQIADVIVRDANDNIVYQANVDEGSGTTIYDSVGTNHGTLTNATPASFWQQSKQLRADLPLISENGLNWNADGVTKSSGQFIGDWKIGSGTYRCKEDATGKYIECVTDGTFILNGIDLSDIVGNGYVKKLTGDLSGFEGGTVAAAGLWSSNKLTLTMTAGQMFRNLVVTRDVE